MPGRQRLIRALLDLLGGRSGVLFRGRDEVDAAGERECDAAGDEVVAKRRGAFLRGAVWRSATVGRSSGSSISSSPHTLQMVSPARFTAPQVEHVRAAREAFVVVGSATGAIVSEVVRPGVGAAAESLRAVPQPGQKAAPGGSGVPHEGQYLLNAVRCFVCLRT